MEGVLVAVPAEFLLEKIIKIKKDAMSTKFEAFWPPCTMSPIAAHGWLIEKIHRKEPCSIIRLGDAEFGILGYPSIAPVEHTLRAFNNWFGHDNFSERDIESLANSFRDAVRFATLIGIPRPSRQQREIYCSYVPAIFSHYQLSRPIQLFSDCGIHRHWQMLLGFEEILRKLPFLGLITCRDISAQIADVFEIENIVNYPIPAQKRFPGDFEGLKSHFPDRFLELLGELTVPFKGAIFLIGAGGFGKVYAEEIRKKGGIAIDVGSVFDGWAKIPSRDFLGRHAEVHDLDSYIENRFLSSAEKVERYRKLLQEIVFVNPLSEFDARFYASI